MVAKNKRKGNTVLALPAIRNDSVNTLSGVVDAEFSWLFLACGFADIACPCDRLFFSRRCGVGAIGAIGEAGIVESSHDRVETVFR